MTVKSLLLIILGGVLVNNYALQKFLGVSPLLGCSGKDGKVARMGLAVTLVMVLTAAAAWPVQVFVLEKLGLGYLQTLVFTAIILVVVYLVDLIIKKAMNMRLGVYFPLIALNSAVLGLAVNNVSGGFNFVESLAAALGTGLGFLFAMFIFSGVQSRIDDVHVPKAFRGLPVSLLAAGILSMALVAFK